LRRKKRESIHLDWWRRGQLFKDVPSEGAGDPTAIADYVSRRGLEDCTGKTAGVDTRGEKSRTDTFPVLSAIMKLSSKKIFVVQMLCVRAE
jgi:hypothetical protein